MTDITPDTILCRAPDLRIDFNARNEPIANARTDRVSLGRHGLAMIDEFREATSVGEVLAKLKPRFQSSQEWIDALRLAAELHSILALIEPEEAQAESRRLTGFDQASIHIAMLNDRTRTKAFLQGIEQQVRPGDIVMDIGTGTGVLAMAAARAGAAKVYAIERGEIGEAAQRLFAENGFGDRIELISGRSTEISLPQPADLITGEILGHDALDEHAIETFLDASRRHLKPEGKILPRSARIHAVPVLVPEDPLRRHQFSPQSLTYWQRNYEFDFSALLEWNRSGELQFLARPETAEKWTKPCGAADFPTIEFGKLQSAIIDLEQVVEAREDCVINGILLYFELEIAEGVELTIEPGKAATDNHWLNPVHLLKEPIKLNRGDALKIGYEHGRSGITSVSAESLSPQVQV
jgi:ubiquinone/menaquinone biosynthesis C-methylase UbiE